MSNHSGQDMGDLELRAQLARYKALFTDAPDGYVVTDRQGTVQAANRRAAALFNVEATALVGQALVTFLEEPPQLFQERLDQLQKGEITALQNWKLHMRRGEGPPFIVAAAVNVVDRPGDAQGGAATAQLRWVLRDVTRDELVAQLTTFFVNVPSGAGEDKIQAALQAIGEFSGADRSYLVLLEADGHTVQSRYAWESAGVVPWARAPKASLAALEWAMAKLTHGESVCVSSVADLPAEAAVERRLWERDGVQSILALPLTTDGALVGFLGLNAERTARVWTAAEVELLAQLVGIFNNMLACKRGLDTLQKRNRELSLLNRAGRVFSSTLYLDEVLVNILEETYHLFDALASSIWLTDRDSGELVCWQATSPYRETVLGWRMAPDQGLVGWVAQHGESLIVPDAPADPRYYPDVDAHAGLTVHAILSVPLRSQHRMVGVLQVVDGRADHFRRSDLQLVESLANTAAIAIENAQLYQQSCQEAETRATLLREVNHRVKNNLAAIIGLLYAECRHEGLRDQPAYQAILKDLIKRVQSLSTAHSLLSAREWAPLRLSELAARIIDAALQALPSDQYVAVDVPAAPVRVTPDRAHHLALLINELATNTAKYALQGRDRARITFRVTQSGDMVRCEFRDDGPGYPEAVLRLERHNVGFMLIKRIVRDSLRGELTLCNDSGAVAIVQFERKMEE